MNIQPDFNVFMGALNEVIKADSIHAATLSMIKEGMQNAFDQQAVQRKHEQSENESQKQTVSVLKEESSNNSIEIVSAVGMAGGQAAKQGVDKATQEKLETYERVMKEIKK